MRLLALEIEEDKEECALKVEDVVAASDAMERMPEIRELGALVEEVMVPLDAMDEEAVEVIEAKLELGFEPVGVYPIMPSPLDVVVVVALVVVRLVEDVSEVGLVYELTEEEDEDEDEVV